MARRWVLSAVVAIVLVVIAVVAARAIRDDDTDTAAPSSTTSSAPTTTTPTSTTTTAPTTTAPPATVTTGPPGPCGTDAGPIRAAVDAGVAGAATGADVVSCRLAASDPSWAAVQLEASAGAQFDARTVILQGGAGSWSVVASGGIDAACGKAPQQVIVDLGQFCVGTGAPPQ